MYNDKKRYERWSIRKVGTGAASVVVAAGVFFFVGSTPVQAAEESTPKVEEKMETLKDISTTNENKPTADSQNEPGVSKEETKDEMNVTENVATPTEVQNAVFEKTKDLVEVPAKYLENANFPGPFTAGVNKVIPYKLFAGDGMLTRLILKESDMSPWSDNGKEMNAPLEPVGKSVNGKYFYEVNLGGEAAGKSDRELLDTLKSIGTNSYKAVIKVYGEKNGKADLMNIIAQKELVVNLNSVTAPEQVKMAVADKTKNVIDVPDKYLALANYPGPFTAGVNEVIPYEFFGGDGMLTRLILKSSEMSPWSDNGKDMNPLLSPVEKLGHGQYFYEVDLGGNTVGKTGEALLKQLKENGTQVYSATIKVYGEKDGKADLMNVVASKNVTIRLYGPQIPMGKDMSDKRMMNQDMSHKEMMNQDMSHKEMMNQDMSHKEMMNQDMSHKEMMNQDMSHKEMMNQDMSHKEMMNQDMSHKGMMNQDMSHKEMMNHNMSMKKDMLPNTGMTNTSALAGIVMLFGTILSLLGIKRRNN